MLQIIRENKIWFISLAIALLIGSIILSQIETGDVIIFFDQNRSPFGDFFFKWFTQVGEEPVYFLLFFIFLFVRFRYSLMIGLVGLIVTIVSFASKSYFLHDRPRLFYEKLRLWDTLHPIEGVHVVTGQSSFPSGHTMSGFALFLMLALILPNKRVVGFLCFLTALFIGISRVYLIQHFLKDIWLGALMGTIISLTLYWIQSKYPINENRWIDRKLRYKKKA